MTENPNVGFQKIFIGKETINYTKTPVTRKRFLLHPVLRLSIFFISFRLLSQAGEIVFLLTSWLRINATSCVSTMNHYNCDLLRQQWFSQDWVKYNLRRRYISGGFYSLLSEDTNLVPNAETMALSHLHPPLTMARPLWSCHIYTVRLPSPLARCGILSWLGAIYPTSRAVYFMAIQQPLKGYSGEEYPLIRHVPVSDHRALISKGTTSIYPERSGWYFYSRYKGSAYEEESLGFFNHICSALLRDFVKSGQNEDEVFGHASDHFAVVETNHMLHIHCLIWLTGNNGFADLKKKV